MLIAIPTRGRTHRMTTIKNLHFDETTYGYKLVIIVPNCEKHLWDEDKYNVETVPDDFMSGDIRQFIMAQHYKEDPIHLLMDDDLRFFKRYEGLTDLHPMNLDEIKGMLKRLEDLSKEYVHGGISAREGNNNYGGLQENCRVMRCYFYDASVIRRNNLRWDIVKCRMDFDVWLSLLELGYYNVCDFEHAQNQDNSGMTGDKYGGCSHYRTEQLMAEQAHVLAELHKPFVKVVKRATKTSFGGGVRTDVRVAWKKAFCSRQSERID